MENKKIYLETLQGELETTNDDMSNMAYDFSRDYDNLDSNNYLNDLMHEYADNRASIYYNEQFDYYSNNVEWCENALVNYGYDLNALLKEKTLYQICCFAGQLGEYDEILGELYSQTQYIIKALALKYCIKNDINVDLDCLYEKIENLSDICRLSDIMDVIKEVSNNA